MVATENNKLQWLRKTICWKSNLYQLFIILEQFLPLKIFLEKINCCESWEAKATEQ